MISKEKLLDSYIENDKGELLDAYVAAAKYHGINSYSCNTKSCCYVECYKSSKDAGFELVGCDSSGALEFTSKQLTLADFKRTKVEYVKCEIKVFHKLAEEYVNTELFYAIDDQHQLITGLETLVAAYKSDIVYRKVETEITWRDEVKELFGNSYESLRVHKMIECNNPKFIEMCHLVSNANK